MSKYSASTTYSDPDGDLLLLYSERFLPPFRFPCNEYSQLTDLFICLPATHGTRSDESDASSSPRMTSDSRIVFVDANGEARTTRLTRLVAVTPVAEPRVCHRRRYEVDVVVDELSPLHQHVTVGIVGRYSRR